MIENIFPTKIYKVNFGSNLKILQENLDSALTNLPQQIGSHNQSSMRNGGICSYNAVRDLHKLPEFKDLVEFINCHVAEYWVSLGYTQKRKPQVLEMWANFYPNSSYIERHDHSPMPVVGSFYLKKPPESGNLCFENPQEVLLKHQPLEKIYRLERSNYDSMLDHEVEVYEGDLVLFPGYLKHYTQPNQSNQDRVIIGVMLDQNYRTRING